MKSHGDKAMRKLAEKVARQAIAKLPPPEELEGLSDEELQEKLKPYLDALEDAFDRVARNRIALGQWSDAKPS